MSINQPPDEPTRREDLFKNNPFRDNPYQSPNPEDNLEKPGGPLPHQPQPGMVPQLPILAILMIVQGGFEIFMGLIQVACAVFMTAIIRTDFQTIQEDLPDGAAEPISAETMSWIMTSAYGGIAAICLLAALLHIWAGIRILGYRGRTLGIIALIVGMASSITCYCAPTAIALGVYGLIVLLNSEVKNAFAMRQQGYSKTQIEDAFASFGR